MKLTKKKKFVYDVGILPEVNIRPQFTQKLGVVITPDYEYNQYLNTLPDNQRVTPNDEYDSYYYWKLNGKPKNFDEAYNKGMFVYNPFDKSYHALSLSFDEQGNGRFMKPKNHPTVHMEVDRYNEGLIYEDNGSIRKETPEEKAEFDNFRNNYDLVDDPDRPNYYMYRMKYADGGKLVNKYDWGGNLLNKAKRTAKTVKGKIDELGQGISDAWDYSKSGVEYALADLFLKDSTRVQKYENKAIKAYDKLAGVPTQKPSTNDTGTDGIKYNSFFTFNQNVPKISAEERIDYLKSLDKQGLMQVQKRLADKAAYDQTLSGSRSYVKKIQQNLIKLGYLPKGEDDGIVGTKTQTAYNKYLRDINVDGVLGNKTINAYLKEFKQSEVSTKGIDGCAQWVTLKYESMANNKSLQNGVFGNAWEMIKNVESKGGSILYNIYDDSRFKGINSVSQLKSITEKVLKESTLNYSKL